MQNKHKFVSVTILTALALGLIAAGGWTYYDIQQQTISQSSEDNLNDTQIVPHTNTQTQTKPKNTTTTSAISIKSCSDSLYKEDRAKYDFWINQYGVLHPEFRMYSIGSYCLLTDGTQLVSFAYFKRGGSQEGGAIGPDAAGQSIALFDANGILKNETKNLYAQTLGDLGPPHIDSVNNGKVAFSFYSVDGGLSDIETFELKLSDFSFIKLGETITP